ncbi:MAG: pseudouridine synthase [Candidatus Methylacidiphilales bacterium]|nr:pseudouridine synthase [Candidatus Methylacidiphilales bacterium]
MSSDAPRLNRYLASSGQGSRRACETLIRDGRVTINGHVVTDLATRVGPGDEVAVDTVPCQVASELVLLLNKPKGVICSKAQMDDRPTVFHLLPPNLPSLFYVGRLDADSEGMLIMTNSGDLAERISHPRNKLPKVYEVLLDRNFEIKDRERLLRGIETPFSFGRMESVDPMTGPRARVVLSQGLKRQVRLMFRFCGYKVVGLRRVQIGGLRMGELKPGQWRELDEKDLRRLMSLDVAGAVAQKPILPKSYAKKLTADGEKRPPARRPSLKSRRTELDRPPRRRNNTKGPRSRPSGRSGRS